MQILLFGSLKPYKGADVLVRAGLLLARHRRDFRITICGKAFYDLEPLRAEIAAAGAADLIHIEARHQSEQELGTQLEEADVVVFPYREIDASGAFACASQFGKPIVATDLGVFAEAPVRDHLRLLPPESPEALAGRAGGADRRSREARPLGRTQPRAPGPHVYLGPFRARLRRHLCPAGQGP